MNSQNNMSRTRRDSATPLPFWIDCLPVCLHVNHREVRQIRTGVMYRHGVLNLDLPFAQLLLDRVWLVFR